CTSYPRIW
nr:immunoglobulin heavy chain junction region [Mus musculus]